VISLESIFAGLALALLVGLLAGVIPARNASQLDPITALRSE
jgi:putative ABC transport system permease protein